MNLPCPHCQKPLLYDPKLADRHLACPICKRPVLVPQLQALPPEVQEEYRQEVEEARRKQEADLRKQQEAELRRQRAERDAELQGQQWERDAELSRQEAEEARLEAERNANAKKAEWVARVTAEAEEIAAKAEASGGSTSAGEAVTKLWKTPKSWLALFDWRFEYYLTPWIIRFLWIAFLLITAVLFLLNTFGLIAGLLPDLSSSPAQPNWGGGNEPGGFALPSWLTVRFVKILLYVMYIIGSIIGILVTRMILEMIIVVFRIAEDIGTLKRNSEKREAE